MAGPDLGGSDGQSPGGSVPVKPCQRRRGILYPAMLWPRPVVAPQEQLIILDGGGSH